MPFGRERGVGEGEEKGNRSRCHSGEGGGKKGIGEGVKKRRGRRVRKRGRIDRVI